MNSSKRRWATGGSFAASPSGSDSDDSDSEDDTTVRTTGAVQLLSLPTAGGLRARKSTGAVQLPSAGGGSDSDDDDGGFGEGVAMLVTSSRCPSRRDSRRIGFGHEVSTSVVHKDDDKALMRLQDEAERSERRRAEQEAQDEAERKAKVQEEGICISEVISMFATGGLVAGVRPGTASRPEPESDDALAPNPTLSPAGASVSVTDADEAEAEEPSPPWSDTDAADRPADDDAGSDEEADEADDAFGARNGRRNSVVQFPGWTANPAKGVASASSAPASGAEISSAGGAETWQAEAAPVDDDRGAERAAAAEAEAAQQARLAKMVAAEAPIAREPEPVGAVDYAKTAADAADDEVDDVSEAVAPRAQWAETGLPQAWEPAGTSEGAEMEFVDEIRARQIEQLVRSGRMPVPSAPSGFQSARSQSRERGSARPTSRGFHASLAAADPTAGMEMMPRPPPKRAGSPSPPTGRRPAPPSKAGGGAPGGRVMAGRTVRGGRTVAAAAPPAAPPVCV